MTLVRLLTTAVVSPTFQVDDATGQIFVNGLAVGTTSLSVEISALQLQTMKASPVVILPSLGSGVIPREFFAIFQYVPVSVDYTLGDATQLFIGSSVAPTSLNVLQTLPASILDGSNGPGNIIGKMSAVNSLVSPQSWFENQSIVLTHNGSAELASGDGTAVVKFYYYSVPV